MPSICSKFAPTTINACPMEREIILLLSLLILLPLAGAARTTYNFNMDWRLHVGDITGAQAKDFLDENWENVSLPRAFNEAEAFRVPIQNLTDTVVWYR